MSFTITFTGTSTFISHDFEVHIFLDEDRTVPKRQVRFLNMILNVDETNNILLCSEQSQYKVKIPIESYELNDITDEMKRMVLELDDEATIDMVPNIHTAKVVITSNRRINSLVENSIGSIFGFKNTFQQLTLRMNPKIK